MEISKTKIKAPIMIKIVIKTTLCNYNQAKNHLLSQLKRMKLNKEFERMYDEVVYAYR